MEIRRADARDAQSICILVKTVVGEKYGHLLVEEPPVYSYGARWPMSWVAQHDGKIIGVGLAEKDYVDDLWVLADFRNKGIGSALLKKLERQILSHGHEVGRLRVIAENYDARRFYGSHDWSEVGTYRHERYGWLIVDLQKPLE